jgi:prepilin-type processing-associated H-X9-DG protein
MEKRKGLTLMELIVTIIVGLLIIAIILPPQGKVKKISHRVVCATNLKGLGTAMVVYANDYDDAYAQLPGTGPWSKRLGFDYDNSTPDFDEGGAEEKTSRTITASLYLLVREADVSPKSFICPENYYRKWYQPSKPKNYTEFTGENSKDLDLVELWDFGPNPHDHVSYAYHNPYGKFPANGKRSAAFAMMADMNPWMKKGNFLEPGPPNQPPQLLTISDDINREQFKSSNAYHHGYEGQNILFGDGHASFERQPNVGVKNDNIYTYWSTDENPSKQDRQGGTAPTARSPENDAKSETDSFLVL